MIREGSQTLALHAITEAAPFSSGSASPHAADRGCRRLSVFSLGRKAASCSTTLVLQRLQPAAGDMMLLRCRVFAPKARQTIPDASCQSRPLSGQFAAPAPKADCRPVGPAGLRFCRPLPVPLTPASTRPIPEG